MKGRLTSKVFIFASLFSFRSFLKGMGAGLFVLAGLVILLSFAPVGAEEIRYQLYKINPFTKKERITHASNLSRAEETIAIQKEASDYGIDPHFSLVIPKIHAVSNIIPNVSTSDQSEYEDALHKGVAHAKGTNFPGQNEKIYLFSHSTNFNFNVARYNAVFYLLRKLENGDEIIIYYADKRFIYTVVDKYTIAANDTYFLTDTSTEGEVLYLQTCDPPGTTWRRFIVKAIPKSI